MTRTTQNSSHKAIEKYVSGIELQGGIYTKLPVVIAAPLTVTGAFTFAGAQIITDTATTAFAVGQNGATNPALNVNTNTATSRTGITLVSAGAGAGFAIQETSSGGNENLTLDAKGSGTLKLNNASTTAGKVTIGNSTAVNGLDVYGNLTVSGGDVVAFANVKAGVNLTVANINVLVNEYLHTPILAAATFAASTSYPLWTAPNTSETWQVTAMSARYTAAAGAAATFKVEVAGAGVAPGSGVAQNSTGVALNGSANTTVDATITTQTAIAAGASINFVVASTATTSLAGLVITVVIQRLT